jgi:hypothetical protein
MILKDPATFLPFFPQPKFGCRFCHFGTVADSNSDTDISRTVTEIIDTVFAKKSPKRSFSMTEYERFGLVFTKT